MGALIARKAATKNSNVLKVVSVTSAPEAGMFLAPSVMLKMLKPSYFAAMLSGKEFVLTQQDACELMGNELILEDMNSLFSLTGAESGRAARDITNQVHVDKIKVPSLVIGAGRDHITRVGIQRQIARRHDSQYTEFTGACHMIPLDSNVQKLAFERITRFLQRN